MANSEKPNKYYVIGLMSGTSLDGLDIVYAEMDYEPFNAVSHASVTDYKILEAETIDYTQSFKASILGLENTNALHFLEWDRKVGTYFGEEVNRFIEKKGIREVDFVASHGHTIYHQPAKGFTIQIGHGASLAAACGLSVVCDFRSLDVALKGQGAPLVPIGDKLLFAEYTYCLNLGGIANISFDNTKGTRMAFDICPANMPLNYLVNKIKLEYDANGQLAAKGKVNSLLLDKLNNLNFYKLSSPKSLGKEWVLCDFIPLLEASEISIDDKLATVCEHIAIQIADTISQNHIPGKIDEKLLITGGGAFNSYLIDRIRKLTDQKCNVIIPDEKTVKFKEALIFALLGVLRWEGEVNCLSSVTGATKDSIGGCIYLNS
jgi:anhydro-N-acetylmuramic acid kinase